MKSSAIARRVVEGRSPFEPDHEHLHHSLQLYGLSRQATLVFMLSLAGLLASVGILAHDYGVADGVLLLGWVACGMLYYQLVRRAELFLGRRRMAGD